MSLLSNNLDFEILKKLQVDGRISFTDLAKEFEVSVSTIRTRYNNLVQDNSIKVYGRINPEKIGLTSYARILLSIRPKTEIGNVLDKLMAMPEISFLASVSGEFDIEINTMCQDNNHLLQLLHEKINQIEGVYNTLTNFYLKIHKFSPPDLDNIKNYIDKNDKNG
jgi:Lrp/AsnC family transcriptional regulator for asnA, asnC and gidA